MRYDEIVGRSWTIVWRYRYLWLLGLLGGGEATVGLPGFGLPGVDAHFPSGQLGASRPATLPGPFVTWLSGHVTLLVTLGLLLLLYALAYFLVSCAATPALVRAAAEHDAERPFSFRIAWQVGLGTFPRILGLRLLVALAWLIVLAILAALLGTTIALVASHQILASIAVGLLLVGLGLLLIPGAIALGLIVTLAVRAIVLEQRRVLAALARSAQLLYRRLGRVLLIWLLGLVLGLIVGLAVSFVIAIVGAFLVAIGIGSLAGLGVASALTAAPVLLFVFIMVTAPLASAGSTYLSVYWTLAFRRLELEPALPYPVVPGYSSPPAGANPTGGP